MGAGRCGRGLQQWRVLRASHGALVVHALADGGVRGGGAG